MELINDACLLRNSKCSELIAWCNMHICQILLANEFSRNCLFSPNHPQPASKSVGDNVRTTNNVSFAPRWVGAINQTTFNPFISAKHVQKRLGASKRDTDVHCRNLSWKQLTFSKVELSISKIHLKGTLKELFPAINKDWLNCLWNPRGGENQPLQKMTPMFKDQGNPNLKL